MLVPIESEYAASYKSLIVILTNLLLFSRYWLI